jgi:hypothetical protein
VEGLRAAAASTNRAVESQNGHGCLGGSSMISSRGRPHFAQDTDVCNLVIRRFSSLPRISASPERLYPPEVLYTVGRACLAPRFNPAVRTMPLAGGIPRQRALALRAPAGRWAEEVRSMSAEAHDA